MDYTPRHVIRLLQLGLGEEAIKSHTPWLCASCQACYTRCPREVNLPRLMEAVRQEARRRGVIKEKNVEIFDNAFLASVKRYGRSHEMGIIIQSNLQSMQPFKDVMLGPPMFFKGKISPLPPKIKNIANVKEIFARARAKGGNKH
jgi:heterodisulfide reductase subunit C